MVPIDSVRPADSPRLAGEDSAHARMLAASEVELPPILVHRQTMRVVDGMHRLRASALRGADTIAVEFFEGTPEDAFIVAVRANIAHGLPLSRGDREAAAVRIVGTHPHWSDRAIAEITGLGAKTVAKLRRQAATESSRAGLRIGRDGRVRPINSTVGRRRAAEVIRDRPSASLREIAKLAEISPGTARDVRARVARGDDPVLPTWDLGRHSRTSPGSRGTARHKPTGAYPFNQADQSAILRTLRRDPSLRLTESGRALLRILSMMVADSQDLERFANTIPPHCASLVADLVDACVDAWQTFAIDLQRDNMKPD